jgi:hypothetical protein
MRKSAAMATPADSIDDPRVYPGVAAAPEAAKALFVLADAALAAPTADRADAMNGEIRSLLRAGLERDAAQLATTLAAAPSAPVARHLWRQLEVLWQDGAQRSRGVAGSLFALPVVVVAALERAGPAMTIPAVLDAPAALVDILREGDALAGVRNFTLANVLAAAEGLALAHWPAIRAAIALPDEHSIGALGAWSPSPSPIEVSTTHESVHLRFLIGVAMTRGDRDLAPPRASAPGHAPRPRTGARAGAARRVGAGATARTDAARAGTCASGSWRRAKWPAQLFVSNALRKLRAATGEPVAVISAHTAPEAIQGGELRVSLSSPFAPRDAEGFCCPLYPQDRVGDVAAMLADILRDCRVGDIRVLPGAHPDRDPATGLRLLFKADGVDLPRRRACTDPYNPASTDSGRTAHEPRSRPRGQGRPERLQRDHRDPDARGPDQVRGRQGNRRRLRRPLHVDGDALSVQLRLHPAHAVRRW